MEMKYIFTLSIMMVFTILTYGQKDSVKVKKGWTFGALPAVSYNSDLGFQYGALASIYDYGDGSTYPKYRKMFKIEVSRYTKGSGINQIFFDSDRLFPKKKIRVTADLSYLTDKACDFYGFNGAEVNFNPAFSNDEDTAYISRMYYRMERNIFRFTCDFQGNISPNLRWLAGVAFLNFQLGTVDIDKLNKGKSEDKKLPDTALLFDKYVKWKMIPAKDTDGGHYQMVKLGLVYDTRDIEANPSRGMWTEALLILAPSFLGNSENSFIRLVFAHRQYFTLIPKTVTFDYRLCYMGNIAGNTPFYLQPYMFSSFPSGTLVEGLGGAKSVRGILRDRVVGNGIVWGNFEFRYKFYKAKKRNIYLALNPFMDAGRVVQKIEVDKSKIPSTEKTSDYFTGQSEKMHFTAGCGLHGGLNENFVVAFDYGHALDKQDGKHGIYVGVNWLF